MNLPNKLTLTRIILVPVFMVFVSLTQIGTEDFNPTWYLVAGIIFAAASFTDFLDGHLAASEHGHRLRQNLLTRWPTNC